MKTVAILGAHRAVAQALVELIEERELDLDVVPATTTEHLGPGLELMDAALLARADLFVACMGGPLIEALVERTDRPVLDLAGVSRGPRLFPGLESTQALDGVVRIPVGPAVPLVSALAALRAFGLERATITTLESAATQDREGMDELSDQVRALFNMRDVEPKAFPATLAFNVIAGALSEAALEEEIADGLSRSGPSPELAVARALVPTFSADAAFVDVGVEDAAPNLETVIDAFRNARGLFYAGEAPVAVAALGRDDALVGRVQAGPRRIAFFLASDRLRRGSATLACLALEGWISK